MLDFGHTGSFAVVAGTHFRNHNQHTARDRPYPSVDLALNAFHRPLGGDHVRHAGHVTGPSQAGPLGEMRGMVVARFAVFRTRVQTRVHQPRERGEANPL